MAFYTGIDCPVCGKKFETKDDVVTCPICGTPSHRSCYEETGHCIHQAEHASGFKYDLKEKKAEQAKDTESTNVATFPVPVQADSEVSSTPKSRMESLYSVPSLDDFVLSVAGSSEKIAGEEAGDLVVVVQKKVPFYFKRFKKLDGAKHKISWNWSAFIFGPYWFFYRRMSKFGAAVLGVQLTIQLVLNAVFSTELSKYGELLNNAFGPEVLQDPLIMLQEANIAKGAEIFTQSGIEGYVAAFLITAILVRLVAGILANGAYRQHCISLIKRVRTKVDKPEFVQQFTALNRNIKSKKDILRTYLIPLGGTSFFSIALGYMGYYIATALISSLL